MKKLTEGVCDCNPENQREIYYPEIQLNRNLGSGKKLDGVSYPLGPTDRNTDWLENCSRALCPVE